MYFYCHQMNPMNLIIFSFANGCREYHEVNFLCNLCNLLTKENFRVVRVIRWQ